MRCTDRHCHCLLIRARVKVVSQYSNCRVRRHASQLPLRRKFDERLVIDWGSDMLETLSRAPVVCVQYHCSMVMSAFPEIHQMSRRIRMKKRSCRRSLASAHRECLVL